MAGHILRSLEFRRQTFHILIGVLIVLFLNRDTKGIFTILLLGIAILGLVISMISKKYNIPIIHWFLSHFDRPGVEIPGKGPLFYVLGSLITIVFFPKDVASAAIMILALGDSVSHIIGRYYGKTEMILSHTKLLEGTIAGIATGIIGAIFFVPLLPAVIGATIAMIYEAAELEFTRIDDNLLIPIVAALAMGITLNLM